MLGTWFKAESPLSRKDQKRLADWVDLPEPDTATDMREIRTVVYDCETSGLNTKTDALLSIGAVSLQHGALDLGEPFESVLRQKQVRESPAVLIHGIGRDTQLGGEDPVEALVRLLEFVGKAPLIAYHAPFDAAIFKRAAADTLGATIKRKWLDLAVLCPLVFDTADSRGIDGLDAWLDRFRIVHPARHDALGDAWAEAQLWQITEAEGRKRHQVTTLRGWLELQKSGKWMR